MYETIYYNVVEYDDDPFEENRKGRLYISRELGL